MAARRCRRAASVLLLAAGLSLAAIAAVACGSPAAPSVPTEAAVPALAPAPTPTPEAVTHSYTVREGANVVPAFTRHWKVFRARAVAVFPDSDVVVVHLDDDRNARQSLGFRRYVPQPALGEVFIGSCPEGEWSGCVKLPASP